MSSMSGKSIFLDSDNVDGKEQDSLNKIKTVLEQGGMTVTGTRVSSNGEGACYNSGANYALFLVGGQGIMTYISIYRDHKGHPNTYIIMGLQGWGGASNATKQGGNWISEGKEWDSGGFATSSIISEAQKWNGQPIKNFFAAHSADIGFVEGNSPEAMAQNILSGNFQGGGSSGSTVEVVEGFIESGRGGDKKSSPQFWNQENYEPYKEIPFQNFKVVEEFPRTMTAEFETIENIDLTNGRVAVLIQGDCNPFGGIILSKKYNSKEGNYTYKCQGFMERIMANSIYAVYNGGKDVYTVIQELLADIGLPDTGLLKKKEYDTAITKENKKKLESDKKLTETSDMYDSDTSDTVTDNTKNISDKDKLNPMKTKVKGIYDKPTVYDFIATLIFKYGVNIDFYGDVNGIPHFDVQDLDTWKKDVWVFASRRGFENNYQYGFDITDAVTQVAVKNISATNGTGEIYTSKDLLGVALEDYIGRMGIVVDNPTSSSGNNTSSDQNGEYQDSSGKKYKSDQILTTNGKPSCIKCKEVNGGKKPTYKSYTKYWYNSCPSCDEEGELSSKDKGDGVTVCDECNTEYCQYCGYELKNHKKRLTELFKTSSNNSTNTSTEDSDD